MNKILLGSLVITLLLSSCNQSSNTNSEPAIEKTSKQESIEYQIMVQRATQTAIWAMPAVGMIDFWKATKNQLGGTINDVVYLTKPFDSKHGFLTANDVTAYSWSSPNCEKGPLVIEVPAATDKVFYFGTIVNVWDQPLVDVGPAGADKGKGAKYLIIPPGYEGEIPESGYIVRDSDSYTLGFSFRPILTEKGTYEDAGNYAKGIKIYFLSEASNPPETNYLDATEVGYDCLPYYDETFFQDINDFVQQNPIREKDKAMISLLKDLGIEKGKEFNPTPIQEKAIAEGLALAYDHMQNYFITEGKGCIPLWPGKSQWQVWNFAEGQPQAGFPYETDDFVYIDERSGGSYFWITYLPQNLGGGTFYLTGLRDSEKNLLNGQDTYKLNVPANTPAKDFWSVIVYSMETKGFIRDAERVGLATPNTKDMIMNEDGSCDIFFGPQAPEGKEANWIPTGEDFFLLFRLYGPESKDFYKTWTLSDIKKM